MKLGTLTAMNIAHSKRKKALTRLNNRITIRDIARKAKVSPSTVSMILNGRPGVGEETRYRVLKVIESLNYTPNLVARSLVKGRSYSIAFLIKSTKHPIFPEIAAGVDEVLKENGYSLSIISTYDDSELESKEIGNVRARGIDGILTSAALVDNENLKMLVGSGFPVVAVLRRTYNCGDLDYVIVDNSKGAYLAVEHLIRLGHQRIGIIKGPSNTSTAIERFDGAMKAFKAYGISVSEQLVHEGDYFQKTGYLGVKGFLKMDLDKRPTAVFANNDDIALGVFEAIWEAGLKIPEDMALVGFNNVEATSFCSIQITTISQRTHEMGRLGAQRLIDRIEKKRGYKKRYQIVLEPELIIRKSCGYSVNSRYVIDKAEHVM
ncbi:MAG: LacI family DNA-binding transcriptional regulator [Pseudomonadota bacterium]